MNKEIVIFGTGKFGEIAHFYLTHDSPYSVVGFTSNLDYMQSKELFGLPVVPFENIEKIFPPENFSMFIAVGYLEVNKRRAKIYTQAKDKGYELISYVNSKATTWNDLEIGDNCFIFENNVIQPFSKIGNDVIIWSGNHIGHHSVIGDHCFISSHVVISGNVSVEPYCFFGVNSTIRDDLKISKECVIGAGSLILKNTREKEVYVGEKAKILSIKSNELTHF